MTSIERFLPKEDRFAALMLYGMIFSTCFNGLLKRNTLSIDT
jgi:hypothetical protein